MLWKTLYDHIRNRIEQGHLKPGDRLASERELVEETGYSRNTIREALRRLEQDGLVEARAGSRGRFVSTLAFADELESWLAEQVQTSPGFSAAWNSVTARYAVVDALVARRHERGMTQADVAAALGVSQPSVSEFEAGGSDPRLSTLCRYAGAVGCEVQITARVVRQ